MGGSDNGGKPSEAEDISSQDEAALREVAVVSNEPSEAADGSERVTPRSIAGGPEDEASLHKFYAHKDILAKGTTSPEFQHGAGLVAVDRVHITWDESSGSDSLWWDKQKQKLRKECANKSCLDWGAIFLPCIKWLRIYDVKSFLFSDIVSGISVGCMAVPQSISYATIAGLPAVYGLYTAFTPVLAYALFGSSRQLAVGPVAVMSLLLSVGLSGVVPYVNDDPNNPEDPEAQALYNGLAIQASLLVGIFYVILGVVRLGFLTNFLSHSVISGFTSGAAIIIGFSQLKYVVGYDIPKSEHIYESIYALFAGIRGFKWYEFVMSSCFLAILMAMKHVGKTYKKFSWLRPLGPLTVTAISVALVYFLRLDQSPGVKIVGNIPAGIPSFTAQLWFPMPYFSDLITVAITMTAVGLMESIAIAKALADKNKYEIDANQELMGLGVSNLVGSMFGAYPCTGSFSRSAVANDTGAKSGLAGGITAIVVLLVLLFITPLFEWMPFNALAAIVISGVLGLVEFHEAVFLFRVAKLDCLVWMASFICTLMLGVEIGLAIAVGLAMLIVIYQSAFPKTAVLGRIPRTTVYRNVKQYPDARTINGLLLIRVDSPIYFANVAYIKDRMKKYELRAEEEAAEIDGTQVQYVILDMAPVSHIDAAAIHALQDIHSAYQKRNVQLILVNLNKQVQGMMVRAGLEKHIGTEFFFVRMHDAVKYCSEHLLNAHIQRRSMSMELAAAESAVVTGAAKPLSANTLTALASVHASEYITDPISAPSPEKILHRMSSDGAAAASQRSRADPGSIKERHA